MCRTLHLFKTEHVMFLLRVSRKSGVSCSHWGMNLPRAADMERDRDDFRQKEGHHHTNEKHEKWFKV